VNASEAFARLRRLKVPLLETADAAAALQQSTFAASKTLARLAESGLIHPVRHGAFWLEGEVDPYRLPEYLSAPYPSYLSLQTALYLHGAIEQVPEVFYAVTLARSQQIDTSAGHFSFHHVTPELFKGFRQTRAGVTLATIEKALFDLAYLSGGRSRRFGALPELELPKGFRAQVSRRWLERIPSQRKRTKTERNLTALLAQAK
jgi:predicted transcriptional regulator of viral defense system